MLNKMSLGRKAGGGFLLVTLLSVCLGATGIWHLAKVTRLYDEIAEEYLPATKLLGRMAEGQMKIWVAERGLVNPRMFADPKVRQAQFDWIDEAWDAVESAREGMGERRLEGENARLWKELQPKWDRWAAQHQAVRRLAEEKGRLLAEGAQPGSPGIARLDERLYAEQMDARTLCIEVSRDLDALIEVNERLATDDGRTADADAAFARRILWLTLIGVIVASMVLGTLFSRSLVGVIAALQDEARRLVDAAVKGRLATRGNPDAVHFEFRGVIEGVNDTLDAVLQPISEASAVLERLARNDLTARVVGDYQGDHAKIKGDLNGACEALEEVVRGIADAALLVSSSAQGMAASSEQAARATEQITETIQQVATGSGQQTEHVTAAASSVNELGQAVDQLAKGAQEQAASAQDAASLMAELDRAIQEISAGSAQQMADARGAGEKVMRAADAVSRADAAVEEVREVRSSAVAAMAQGEDAVARTVEGMQRIEATTAQAADRIADLGERSHQIGEIIQVIDDIADQTNLLALNAAIEAARAGEHGKGFAVVADEVRKLAERSGKATKEIATLIDGIRDGVSHTIAAMQEGRQEVSRGVEVVQHARTALDQIRQVSQTTNERVVDIAKVLAEVSEISAQVEQAVQAIAGEVTANAARAQQMAASAQTVVRSVESIAAVTEQATASTEEMSAGAAEIARTVESVAAISEENAASAEEVSAAAEEQAAGVQEMAANAQKLAEIAARVQELVGQFRVGSEADEQPRLRIAA